MSDGESATVGALLKNRRLSLEISLREIAAQTRIRRTYLEALENDRFDLLPGGVYIGGFLRVYSQVLGLDPGEMSRQYQDQIIPRRAAEEQKTEPARSFHFIRGMMVAAIILTAFTVFKMMGHSPASTAVEGEIVERPTIAEDRQMTDPGHAGRTVAEPVAASLPVAPGPSIPPGGAVISLKASGPGFLELVLDDHFHQRYELKADVELGWKVSRSARLMMDNPAAVTVWLDQDKIDLAGRSELVFLSAEGIGKD